MMMGRRGSAALPDPFEVLLSVSTFLMAEGSRLAKMKQTAAVKQRSRELRGRMRQLARDLAREMEREEA